MNVCAASWRGRSWSLGLKVLSLFQPGLAWALKWIGTLCAAIALLDAGWPTRYFTAPDIKPWTKYF
jgi:hypothetical protein